MYPIPKLSLGVGLRIWHKSSAQILKLSSTRLSLSCTVKRERELLLSPYRTRHRPLALKHLPLNYLTIGILAETGCCFWYLKAIAVSKLPLATALRLYYLMRKLVASSKKKLSLNSDRATLKQAL